MSDVAIHVENVSKVYRLGSIGRRTLQRDFARWWANRRGKPDPYLRIGQKDNSNQDGEQIWALRDISMQVRQGEIVGIIGRNGAGKSTLLKIFSRITAPTTGQVKIKGRIGSLLEVGTGFHPELTGRENIYLNGAILGMTRAEVDRKFDEIVDFSGVEQYIDTPVKRFSSGMHVRLAFAVAAHLEPEILVVDEVLAVGDAEFRKKSLGKMEDVAQEGRTVLLVSHNMAAIQTICERSIWIDEGQIVFSGPSNLTVDKYLSDDSIEHRFIVDHVTRCQRGVHISKVVVNGSEKDRVILGPNDNRIDVEIIGSIAEKGVFEIEAKVLDRQETVLASYLPDHEGTVIEPTPQGEFSLRCSIRLPRIMKGDYYLNLYLTDPGLTMWAEIPRAVQLHAQGTLATAGRGLEYHSGGGWMLLDSADSQ